MLHCCTESLSGTYYRPSYSIRAKVIVHRLRTWPLNSYQSIPQIVIIQLVLLTVCKNRNPHFKSTSVTSIASGYQSLGGLTTISISAVTHTWPLPSTIAA